MPLVETFVGAYHRTCSNICCIVLNKFSLIRTHISAAQVDVLVRDLHTAIYNAHQGVRKIDCGLLFLLHVFLSSNTIVR